MRSQGRTVRALVASKLKRLLGVDPPERAMVKRPRCATASVAARMTSSAAAANNSCGVVRIRTSTEEVTAIAQFQVEIGGRYTITGLKPERFLFTSTRR